MCCDVKNFCLTNEKLSTDCRVSENIMVPKNCLQLNQEEKWIERNSFKVYIKQENDLVVT